MVDRPSPQQEEDLNTFWNDLVRPSGAPDTADQALSPALAATVRRLHALAAAPPPAASRERVWRGVRQWQRSDDPISRKESPMVAGIDVLRPNPNGRIRTPQPILLEGRPRSMNGRTALAIAAILVIALVGGIAGGLIQDRLDGDDPRSGPAIMAPATPIPDDTGTTTLFEITIPAKAMPPMGRGAAALQAMTAEPNSEGVYAGNACCPGILVLYMIDGTYTVQPDLGSITVYRAGLSADSEEVETGTSVELGPGDVLLAEKSAFVGFSNPASTPVTFLTWQLEIGSYQSDPARLPLPEGWTRDIGNADRQHNLALPRADATLRLEQVTVAEGETMPMPADVLVQVVEADFEGAPRRRQRLDGSIAVSGEGPMTLYVLTILSGSAPGTPTP